MTKKVNNALELAFKKAVEESTKKDKDAVKAAMFSTNAKVKSPKKESKKSES
jgi:hypothetical protein